MHPLLARPSLLGAVLAIVVGAGAYLYLQGQEDATSGATILERVPVLVAMRAIAHREPLTALDVEVQRIPIEAVHPFAVKDLGAIEGMFADATIRMGEQILSLDLTERPSGGGLAELIPDGYRAFSIGVSDAMAAGGLVKPGDRLDLIAVFQEQKAGRDGSVSVVQNVEVLAVSRVLLGGAENDAEEGKTNPTSITATVTVALLPTDAQRVALADEFGAIRLALRRTSDTSQPLAPSIDLSDVSGIASGGGAAFGG